MPPRPKQLVTDLIPLFIYWPLACFAALAEALGMPAGSLLLSCYSNCSIYTMRIDARDHFGTPLEQRFSRYQIRSTCIASGLVNLHFSPSAPYWCVVGLKASI